VRTRMRIASGSTIAEHLVDRARVRIDSEPWLVLVPRPALARCLAFASCLACLPACSSDQDARSTYAGSTSSTGSTGTGSTGAGSSGATTTSGGTTVSTTVGGVVISVDSGSGGPDTGASFANCASDTRSADPKPVDIFVMLDQSGSMTLEGDRWAPVTNALKAFVDDPKSAGIGMALNYFPRGMDDVAKCDIDGYATPEVPMAPLDPTQAAAIKRSIDAHNFTVAEARDVGHSGTPTRPALVGAIQYVTTWIAAHPTHVGMVLLATDGQPSSGLCAPNRVPDLVTVAQMGAAGMPAVPTFVIGIGALASLNDIAQAGGTGYPAFIVDGTGLTTQQEFLRAMNVIRATALPCDYAIPAVDGGMLDPALVNVQYVPGGGGASRVVPKAMGGAPCTGEGWVYDNEAQPTKVVMCEGTCSTVQQDSMATIKIVFGCQTIVR
jgi:hypothetical protein